MNQRKMRIGMSIRGHGYHPAAWRHPDVPADGTLQVEHYMRSAQTAERGKIDMIFFADGAGIRQGDNPPGSLARTGRDMIELEPTMLLPALAMVTSHIGLVTTASTTYNEPYNLARRFATLDLISKGRAGWNVVASWSEHEAQNFGLETLKKHFPREIGVGAAELHARMGSFIVANIFGMTPPAGTQPIKNESSRAMLSIFFAKTRMGWKETVVSEHANADGKPFIFEVSKTDAKL